MKELHQYHKQCRKIKCSLINDKKSKIFFLLSLSFYKTCYCFQHSTVFLYPSLSIYIKAFKQMHLLITSYIYYRYFRHSKCELGLSVNILVLTDRRRRKLLLVGIYLPCSKYILIILYLFN